MTTRTESNFLALACIFSGVLCALVASNMSSICRDLEFSPPFFTRVILSVGAVGWLLTFIVVAGIALWKEFWKGLRIPNSLLVATTAVILCTFDAAVLLLIIQLFLSIMG